MDAKVLTALMLLTLLPAAAAWRPGDPACDLRPLPEVPDPVRETACHADDDVRGLAGDVFWFLAPIACEQACPYVDAALRIAYFAEDEAEETPIMQDYREVRRSLVPDSCPSDAFSCLDG